MLTAAIAALASLLGVLLGAYLPRRFDQTYTARARYDAAVTAAAKLQAARNGVGLNIPQRFTAASSIEEHETIVQELSTDAVKRFLQAASDARASLAELYPYSPDLKIYWDKFEISPDELDNLIATLTDRRKRPLRRHRIRPTRTMPS
ncbi:hypothetical protein ABZV93_04435 [Actinopolymorpha sp. NPDC004070]|uniref:hypothetical protein n=1 Tax=Actinopolymorpha sp. NPDC004070 TaxID=3154548 RepID=UPI0033AD2802